MNKALEKVSIRTEPVVTPIPLTLGQHTSAYVFKNKT